uniref:Uncharacterized protein n=1 Tax=Rhizophora mucronata TaxID=61149 RepID=A0A2P2P9Y0_RHIMU
MLCATILGCYRMRTILMDKQKTVMVALTKEEYTLCQISYL